MSELAALTRAGNQDVLPGFILSRPRLPEISSAEKEFAKQYLEFMNSGTANLPTKAVETIMLDAKNDILLAKFSWGGPIFNLWALATSSLPYLTWLCLRVKHPQVTQDQIAGWYAGATVGDSGKSADPDELAAATWAAWGFAPEDTKKKGEGAAPPNPPTGSESTTDAAPQPPPDSGSPPNNSTT